LAWLYGIVDLATGAYVLVATGAVLYSFQAKGSRLALGAQRPCA